MFRDGESLWGTLPSGCDSRRRPGAGKPDNPSFHYLQHCSYERMFAQALPKGAAVQWALVVVGRVLGVVLLGAAALSACGGGSEELTVEQHLEKLTGGPLSSVEVDEQLALADTMCGFDGRVLIQIWDRLDARQLEFQDYVFGRHCPDRLSVYEEVRPNMGTVPDDIASATTSTTIMVDDRSARIAAEVLDSIRSADDPATASTTTTPTTGDSTRTTR